MAGLTPLTPSERKKAEAFLDYPLGPLGRKYLERRGLLAVAEELRLGEIPADAPGSHHRYAGRLAIPSFSARGTVTNLTFRCMENHVCEGHGKYDNLPGLSARLYHVESVTTNRPVIHLAEGQLDAATLIACGLPAVGVPGANAWRASSHRLFQGFDRVVFWADQDDKGSSMNLFKKIRQGVPAAEVMMVAPGQDVNSFYVERGRERILSLLEDKPEEADDDELDDGVPVHLDSEGRVIPF